MSLSTGVKTAARLVVLLAITLIARQSFSPPPRRLPSERPQDLLLA